MQRLFSNRILCAALAGICLMATIIGCFHGYDAMIRYLTGGIWAI